MTMSVLFSAIIYQVATSEIDVRLTRFQSSVQQYNFDQNGTVVEPIRLVELDRAKSKLSIELLYVNAVILFVGGIICYFLAKWHLQPIEIAHEAQSRFTSDASHELRTPLAAMKTEIEVALRDKNPSITELKETLASNLEEVDKLTKLSEMLLNLSRLDSDKLEISLINLGKLSKKITSDFGLPESRIKVFTQKNLIIRANETAIADVLKILIDNALKYSPKDSQIKINVKKKDQGNIIFEIINSGPGISAEKLPFIFERFFRGDNSRTCGECKGYGLGLALAKKIIELHNGQIFAESTPNESTTVYFVLPKALSSQAKSQN
jgi:signal transduction histidine kinase